MIKLKSMLVEAENLNYYYISTQYGLTIGGQYTGVLGIVRARNRKEAFEKMKLPKPQNHYEIDLISKSDAKRRKKGIEVQFKGWQSAMKNTDV